MTTLKLEKLQLMFYSEISTKLTMKMLDNLSHHWKGRHQKQLSSVVCNTTVFGMSPSDTYSFYSKSMTNSIISKLEVSKKA